MVDSKDVQLEHFGFSVDANDIITQALMSVQTTKAVSSISSLGVTCNGVMGHLPVSQSLIALCGSLKNLTHLKFTCKRNNMVSVLDILQNLTTLKSLEFDDVMINGDTSLDMFHNKLSTIRVGGLELICSSINSVSEATSNFSINKLDLLLSFVLRSCPNFKIFKFTSYLIRARGVVSMDFGENSFLQHINLTMADCQYFTYHHEPGNYWKNISEQIFQHDQEASPYQVELAWDTTRKIKLTLVGSSI